MKYLFRMEGNINEDKNHNEVKAILICFPYFIMRWNKINYFNENYKIKLLNYTFLLFDRNSKTIQDKISYNWIFK